MRDSAVKNRAMNSSILKRQCAVWGYTLLGLFLLFGFGLMISFWLGSDLTQLPQSPTNILPLLGWRMAVYSGLLVMWPRLTEWLTHPPKQDNRLLLSRRPLVLLILAYELLIVQNPLALLLQWLR